MKRSVRSEHSSNGEGPRQLNISYTREYHHFKLVASEGMGKENVQITKYMQCLWKRQKKENIFRNMPIV